MQIILFTKFLTGFNSEQVADAAREVGVDGLDLAIRDGHVVNAGNAIEALPAAMTVWRQAGLTVPLATLGMETDPTVESTRAIYAACGAAGIPFIKLGYWLWSPEQHYWDTIAAIRDALAGFQELGAQYGICSLIHTHSDNCYGSNAAGAMHMAQGFDPRYIGIYPDPAHLAADGEFPPMALDITRGYLKVVGVKNVRYVRQEQRWVKEWCPLDEGLVDWQDTMRLLREDGFDGPLAMHGEYTGYYNWPAAKERLQRDVPLIRACVNGVSV